MKFTTDLLTLNSAFGSSASGKADLTLEAPSENIRTLRVQIEADGLEDVSAFGGVHVAHIHGQFEDNASRPLLEQGDGEFFDGDGGEAVNSILPTLGDSDVDGDGFLNFLEGRPNYGPVVLNLTSTQIEAAPDGTPPLTQFLNLAGAGEINPAELFPSGTEFNLDTTYTFDLSDPDQERQFNNLMPLNQREIVLHGLTIPVATSEAIDNAAMGTAPTGIDLDNGEAFRITAPVAAGTISVALPDFATKSQFLALTDDNTIVSFDLSNPQETTSIDVTGVKGVLLGIDTRPANGLVYGLTTANVIYTIDPDSGKATYVSTLDLPFEGGTISGFDFNPAADRLRLVGDNDQDFRINVETGEVIVDGTLAFAEGDVNDGVNPNVTAAAYTNSFDGTTSTQLYDIDTLLNDLVLQDPPNDGTLVTVGDLGVDFDTLGGFDIVSSIDGENAAFAVSDGTLYRVDLATGEASNLGTLGDSDSMNLQGLTIAFDNNKMDVEFDLPIEEAQTVPEVPDTDAEGSFDAVLEGNMLTIMGEFSDLTSPLLPVGGEDSAGNPESSIHVHIGEVGEGGPILRNLNVIDDGDRSGSFEGTFKLSSEDAALAEADGLYVNLHTENNTSGELRGQVIIEEDDMAVNNGTLIDLSGMDTQSVNFTVSRNAVFDSTIGFYEVANTDGGVVDPMSGETIAVGESGYLEAAIANSADIALTAANKDSAEFGNELAGDAIYAPYIVVNGTVAELEDADSSNDPTVYFTYLGANADGSEHIRSLDANTLGFEDLPNGGDMDFNDLIVEFELV